MNYFAWQGILKKRKTRLKNAVILLKDELVLKRKEAMVTNPTYLILLLLLLQAYSSSCQTTQGGSYVLPGIVLNGDTLAKIEAKAVVLLPPAQLPENNEIKQFRRLVKNIKIVYPYSQIGKKIFREIEITLDTMPNKRDRKAYIKTKERELLRRYGGELKKLSVTQGQILMKMIDRELNKTSYEIIKEMRGSFQAIMWQQMARIFGSDLRSTYEPEGEDMMMEKIIVLLETGQL